MWRLNAEHFAVLHAPAVGADGFGGVQLVGLTAHEQAHHVCHDMVVFIHPRTWQTAISWPSCCPPPRSCPVQVNFRRPVPTGSWVAVMNAVRPVGIGGGDVVVHHDVAVAAVDNLGPYPVMPLSTAPGPAGAGLIDQHAAALAAPGGPPFALLIVAVRPPPGVDDPVHTADFAQFAGLHQVGSFLYSSLVRWLNMMPKAAGLGGSIFVHLAHLLGIHGGRLFHQRMHAMLQRVMTISGAGRGTKMASTWPEAIIRSRCRRGHLRFHTSFSCQVNVAQCPSALCPPSPSLPCEHLAWCPARQANQTITNTLPGSPHSIYIVLHILYHDEQGSIVTGYRRPCYIAV